MIFFANVVQVNNTIILNLKVMCAFADKTQSIKSKAPNSRLLKTFWCFGFVFACPPQAGKSILAQNQQFTEVLYERYILVRQ
jgi:hypothetical protein